jgi:hypothetical protein
MFKHFCTLLTFFVISLSYSLSFAEDAFFEGNIKATWNNPIAVGENPKHTGVDTNHFTWGEPAESSNEPNSLVFAGEHFREKIALLFSRFKIGTITYHNDTVDKDTDVSRVTLNIDFLVENPSLPLYQPSFEIEIENTPNENKTPEEAADSVYFPSHFPKQTFSFAGKEYRLEIVGFTQDNGTTLTEKFWVFEGKTTSADLYAKVKILGVDCQCAVYTLSDRSLSIPDVEVKVPAFNALTGQIVERAKHYRVRMKQFELYRTVNGPEFAFNVLCDTVEELNEAEKNKNAQCVAILEQDRLVLPCIEVPSHSLCLEVNCGESEKYTAILSKLITPTDCCGNDCGSNNGCGGCGSTSFKMEDNIVKY